MRRRAAAGDERLPLPAHDEIRRLGETLNAMLARLRGSLERERRFVADASHELRTPLAVLKTELEARAPRAGPPARGAPPRSRRSTAWPARRGPAGARPTAEGGCRCGRDAPAAAARGRPRPLRRPRRARGARHRVDGRRRDVIADPLRAPPGARQPGGQRAAPRRRRGRAARGADDGGVELEVPTRGRASRRTSPDGPSSASPAGTAGAARRRRPGPGDRARDRRGARRQATLEGGPPCASGCRLRAVSARRVGSRP